MAKSALALQTLPEIRVLLVEDNSSDAFVVSSLLNDNHLIDYRAHHVRLQSEAVALLATESFNVCLLDLNLSDTDGFSALINIQEKAPGMPVLILTGMNDMALAKRAVGRGAQDYLLKDELEIGSLSRAIDYAMERKRLEKDLFQRANCDTLTDLANRDMFQSRLQMAVARSERSGSGVAVLFIDLDHFKHINDTHGHDAGDAVLKNVAQRIRAALRIYDTPARFGGDEFAVLLEGIHNARDAATVAHKILRSLSVPLHYHGQALCIGASIGIAFSDDHIAPETLLQHADIAMYHAKKEYGNAYRFYTESMHEETSARLNLEEDLRNAISSNQLRIAYQPCVNPDGEAVIGVEALLRWMHPARGLLLAHEFLPAAETSRLMPRIAKWMCLQLYQDIAMWNAKELPPLNIAINLSISQVDAPDMLEWITPIANKEFLGHHTLAVEIAEEAIVPISGARFMALAMLHDRGVSLHLDHFGHRSLPMTTLCSLPFSLLKIDRTLIQNMNKEIPTDVLISTAILLAHHLGMKAGAVGVEEQWQARALKAQSCDVIQGFLTMEPMTAGQLVSWLKEPPFNPAP